MAWQRPQRQGEGPHSWVLPSPALKAHMAWRVSSLGWGPQGAEPRETQGGHTGLVAPGCPPATGSPRRHRSRARRGGPGACILAGCEWSCLLICSRAKNNSQPCIQSCEKSPIARRRVTGRQPSLGDGGCCGDGALRTAVQPWHPWSPRWPSDARHPVPPAGTRGGRDGSPAKANGMLAVCIRMSRGGGVPPGSARGMRCHQLCGTAVGTVPVRL